MTKILLQRTRLFPIEEHIFHETQGFTIDTEQNKELLHHIPLHLISAYDNYDCTLH